MTEPITEEVLSAWEEHARGLLGFAHPALISSPQKCILTLISGYRALQKENLRMRDALKKMANHNDRLAMKDRPGMTPEGWAVDKAFSMLAEEALGESGSDE